MPPIPPDYDSHLVGLDRNEVGARLVAARPGTAAEAALVSLLAINGLRISEALGADIGARPRLGSYAGSVKGPAADEHAVHRLTSPSELSLVYQVRLLEAGPASVSADCDDAAAGVGRYAQCLDESDDR